MHQDSVDHMDDAVRNRALLIKMLGAYDHGMSLKGLHRHRRFAAALALAGMAFYAVLLPWHTVSQATTALVASGVGTTSAAPCHDASAATKNEQSPKGSAPSNKSHCPICSGFAALQLTLAGAAIDVATPPEAGSILPHCRLGDLASIKLPAPQSRGPPRFPV